MKANVYDLDFVTGGIPFIRLRMIYYIMNIIVECLFNKRNQENQ